jgi:hypothetical protein
MMKWLEKWIIMMMDYKNRNACAEAFEQLKKELKQNQDDKRCEYWLFERGYRAAVEALLVIAESGKQEQKFVSPRLQSLAERLIAVNDCV